MRLQSSWKVTLAGIAIIALVWLTVDQAIAYAAYRRFHDVSWRPTASQDETRRAAEQSLAWWFGDAHEAFVVLTWVGDESSLPFIRAALARRPGGDEACTWGHGDEAVEAITTGRRPEPGSD